MVHEHRSTVSETVWKRVLWLYGLYMLLSNAAYLAGYYPISLGLFSGLISGTNSFAASNLRDYNAWDGMAFGLSIGGVEMLAYILVIAATAGLGVYPYRSWWRWSGAWAPVKLRRLRDIRLSRSEIACLALGIVLLIAAAYRETWLALQA